MANQLRALLIEWDPKTGKRAGGIDPNDPKLQCYGWQNMEVEPALEIRLVEDDRDLSQYEGVKGVTILIGKEAINEAIRKYMPEQEVYSVGDEALFRASLEEKKISLDQFKGKKPQEILKDLHENKGVAGIVKRKRYELLK